MFHCSSIKQRIFPFLIVAINIGFAFSSNFNQPLDAPFTQRGIGLEGMLKEHGRLTEKASSLSFIFPRPCESDLDSSNNCMDSWRLKWKDEKNEVMGRPLVAMEYRNESIFPTPKANPFAVEVGAQVAGNKGPASFMIDVRMFTEKWHDKMDSAFDGEPSDKQDDSTSGSISYQSYSRYRGNLNLETPIGRISATRDAAHWGPALFTNLVFSQEAIPFNQYTLTTHLGPFSVTTLYGDLMAHPIERANKSVYAHRYEARIGEQWLLSISEQIILTDENKPYFFVPIFPLFIAKGFMHESSNNGNLSADLTYKIPGHAILYSEFLLDDLESPSSLVLKDYRQNKWAWMVGTHWSRNFGSLQSGVVVEHAVTRPWVGTHFSDYPAGATNRKTPLGNPYGPDSRVIIAKTYAGTNLAKGLLKGSLLTRFLWKGQGDAGNINAGYGSDVNARHFESAPLLENSKFSWSCEPTVSFTSSFYQIEAISIFGSEKSIRLRTLFWY